MLKLIDLTHKFKQSMPVHKFDEPATITKVRHLKQDYHNDWLLSSGMHVGTHIDGPGHLTDSHVLMSDMPVDRFIGKGYLIDARNKETIDKHLLDGMPVVEDLIVLIFTGLDKKFGTQDYFEKYPVIALDFAQEVVKRKIKMIGIDFFSPDYYPFDIHKLLLEHNILIIENLTNLDKLLKTQSFTVFALPLKTETDSALARVIAIVD